MERKFGQGGGVQNQAATQVLVRFLMPPPCLDCFFSGSFALFADFAGFRECQEGFGKEIGRGGRGKDFCRDKKLHERFRNVGDMQGTAWAKKCECGRLSLRPVTP